MRLPYIKFYPRDYQSNPELQCCSLSTRGFWVECLCIMAQAPRYGYLEIVSGVAMDLRQLSRLTRCGVDECEIAIAELSLYAVCAKDDRGVMFSRRMVRDEIARERAAVDGQKGASKKNNKEIPIAIPNTTPTPTEPSRGGEGVGLKGTLQPTLQPTLEGTLEGQFAEFWKKYPRKVDKANANKAFKKALSKTSFERITEGLVRAKTCEQWTRDCGRFIPHAATWLNAERWEDEVKQPELTLAEKQMQSGMEWAAQIDAKGNP